MAPVSQPWTGHADMVGSAFSTCFDKQAELFQVGTLPRRKRIEQLQPVGFGIDDHFHAATVFGGSLVARISHRKTTGRKIKACRFCQPDLFSICIDQRIGHGVEFQRAGNGIGRHDLR